MNVFMKPQTGLSKAMDRVVKHLSHWAPDYVNIVDAPEDADLVVLHVINYPETEQAIRRLKALGKKYAMIQYCLRTTQEPSVVNWLPIWNDAEFVWSYYDLPALCMEDGLLFPETISFMYAPLGVDQSKFNKGLSLAKYPYKVLTTGTVTIPETIDLVNNACAIAHGTHAHVGILTEKPGNFDESSVHYVNEISDDSLAQLLRQTEYVCGLRRIEGFELPAAEGLLCGAVPILFDRPHYRHWFGDFGALFIKEGTDEEILLELTHIFNHQKTFWPPRDIEGAKKLFNWRTISEAFWGFVEDQSSTEPVKVSNVQIGKPSRRLLWIGDAVSATGFAKCTHQILSTVQRDWDVAVLGLNYFGDPHQYPYPIYPCVRGGRGDFFGISRIPQLIEALRPELVVVQNDTWNFPQYLKAIGNVPTVGIVAVDGKNCRGKDLNGLLHAIFWTDFGAKEAALGGYRGSSTVIPLGVDLDMYKPIDRKVARDAMGLPQRQADGFIVGNINRNQPRKRMDLTIAYFCEWVKTYRVDDAFLYLHIAPTADAGYDASQLMQYYGLTGRLIIAEPEPGYGIKESALPYVYNSFDVQVSTTQGEGFGLTTLEGMACGVPQIFPNWAALGDLFADCCDAIPCTTTSCTPNNINVVGGVADKDAFIGALQRLYRNPLRRISMSDKVLTKAQEPRFRWSDVGERYLETFEGVFVPKLAVADGS